MLGYIRVEDLRKNKSLLNAGYLKIKRTLQWKEAEDHG
jgi:hypothetical protein